MKPAPIIYSLGDIRTSCAENTVCIDGKWVPMRPVGFCGLVIVMRLKTAWRVFTGELDAIKWPGWQ
jgi:hypothetical protein